MQPTENWVKNVIARPEVGMETLPSGLGRVLVTGGEGSVGSALRDTLVWLAHTVRYTDVRTMDVRDERQVMSQFINFEPDLVLHLAASKHAPLGEEDPYEVTRTNIVGTKNVLDWCDRVGARCVMASTCKACDPETAYGSTKLVAERMALNQGHCVVRYYNVVETSGNVFQIWRETGQLTYTECERRFTSLNEALHLTLWVAALGENARYTLTTTVSRKMRDVLASCYPDSENHYRRVPLRRGDRVTEPQHATCEQMESVTGWEWISRVVNPHDPPTGRS